MRHLRLLIFLGELNNLELWGADIGNAYLEAYTNKKIFIIGGAEFEELEGLPNLQQGTIWPKIKWKKVGRKVL